MNFDYSDDQKMLKDEARKFLAAKCDAKVVRGVLDHEDRAYDEALWKGVAEQGWLGVAIPEEHGGLGLGHVELCGLAEELGRACAPIPFASTVYFVAEALMKFGSPEQKAKWLPKIAAGEVIGAFATAEGKGPVTARSIGTTVSGGKLSGEKIPVTDGDVADLIVVLAKDGLYLVEKGEGVAAEVLVTLDPTRSAAKLVFTDAPAERLGSEDGIAAMQAVFDRAAVLLAFEQIGGADKSLEMAKDYALSRYAFGRQIGGYQAIKHKLADMYVKNEVARSNAYYGAWALNTDAGELPLAAATARVAASDAFWFAAKENIQTHGGIGFTWEADPQLYYRRSRQLSLVAGAPATWRERLVSQLEMKNAA
ncbi:acyl-CoA dehydrogenase family protein [Sphingomonas radiodurans]|uniref:acyl-CoA dehydrogenase family protein n=1 Tax=Sphingomonas radiodurans TaxID=2890321 RepID=UPI001E314375|nr:acyl-CoA dehydrogenase family protein [Sphingomonas radiodurans]WBH17213.1 acyl-CoA/acyl-ACP dehydrogenase [Sphingomonas radiodurans]